MLKFKRCRGWGKNRWFHHWHVRPENGREIRTRKVRLPKSTVCLEAPEFGEQLYQHLACCWCGTAYEKVV